jgi:hypothetical protein
MKMANVLDALVAALILFIGNLVTLFVENNALELADIKQATWIVIGGGAFLSFLKAARTVDLRKGLETMTGGSTARSPLWIGVVLALVFLSLGCASQLDLREGDVSMTLVEIDAEATTPGFGGVEADGCMLILRGVDLAVIPLDGVNMSTPTCSFGRPTP